MYRISKNITSSTLYNTLSTCITHTLQCILNRILNYTVDKCHLLRVHVYNASVHSEVCLCSCDRMLSVVYFRCVFLSWCMNEYISNMCIVLVVGALGLLVKSISFTINFNDNDVRSSSIWYQMNQQACSESHYSPFMIVVRQ